VIALVFQGLLLSAFSCEPDAREVLNKADDLSFKGKHEAAMAKVERALEILSKDKGPKSRELRIEALWSAGRITHLYLRQPHVALRYYQRLIDDFPDAKEAQQARERMARIRVEDLDDRPGSIGLYQALVAANTLGTEAPRWQHEIALGYYSQGNWAQARTEAERVLEHYPSSDFADDALFLMGGCYQAEGKLNESIKVYGRLVSEHPGSNLMARALVEEGNCLAKLDRSNEALDAYIRALETHPDPSSVQVKIKRLKARLSATSPEAEAFARPHH